MMIDIPEPSSGGGIAPCAMPEPSSGGGIAPWKFDPIATTPTASASASIVQIVAYAAEPLTRLFIEGYLLFTKKYRHVVRSEAKS
jgi:hypothetical protein